MSRLKPRPTKIIYEIAFRNSFPEILGTQREQSLLYSCALKIHKMPARRRRYSNDFGAGNSNGCEGGVSAISFSWG